MIAVTCRAISTGGFSLSLNPQENGQYRYPVIALTHDTIRDEGSSITGRRPLSASGGERGE